MAYVGDVTGLRRLPSITGVAAVHALIGYAFISALAMNVIHQVVPVFTVNSIRDTPPPPPNIPRPPASTARLLDQVAPVVERPFDAAAQTSILAARETVPA